MVQCNTMNREVSSATMNNSFCDDEDDSNNNLYCHFSREAELIYRTRFVRPRITRNYTIPAYHGQW